jgi:hypothetical protein
MCVIFLVLHAAQKYKYIYKHRIQKCSQSNVAVSILVTPVHYTSLIVSCTIKYLSKSSCSFQECEPGKSVQCLTTGWTTGRSRFYPRQRQMNFSCSLWVQTGSGTHPASCTVGTGGPFPGLKRGQGMTLTTHPI